jgi:hypothetical protein
VLVFVNECRRGSEGGNWRANVKRAVYFSRD